MVEEPISDFELRADYEAFQLDIEQPIVSTSSESLTLGVGIEHTDSETFVLGDLSLALTDGLEDGRSRITALRFNQEYFKNGSSTLLAASSQFNVGFDALDATRTELGIDGIFWSWRGDFQYLKALNESRNVVLATRLTTQLTPARLLPSEQITVGGIGSVRGYRPNLGVADNGALGTLELRLPLVRDSQYGEIQIIPFTDIGTIWNNGRETTGTTNTFASVGLSLRYRLRDFWESRIDYGIPLIAPQGFGATDTEDRFSFALIFRPLKF